MKLRYRCFIITPEGGPLVGANIWFTPRGAGPIAPNPGIDFGVQATEVIPAGSSTGIGEYEVIINPNTVSSANIAKLYDVWQEQGGVYEPLYYQRYIGAWQWVVENMLVSAETVVSFSDLQDTFLDTLPTTIPSATVTITRHYVDRMCYISAITDTTFTIVPSVAGSDDAYVDLVVSIK